MAITGKMPKVAICKEYHFSSAHWLPNVGDGHPCKRLHGHNYKVEIIAYGEMNQRQGWLVDFAEIDKYAKPLIAKLDHRNLNDFLENPTAEWLAWWIHSRMPIKYIETIRVWETAKCYAETRGTLPEWLKERLGWTVDSTEDTIMRQRGK